jgi:hypothetical protein
VRRHHLHPGALHEHLAADLTRSRLSSGLWPTALTRHTVRVLDDRTQELLVRSYVRHDGVLDRVNMGKATGPPSRPSSPAESRMRSAMSCAVSWTTDQTFSMTFTRDQAQMLATLATACRPNGARRWDPAGVMAALEKLRDRDLAEVIMATVRAARDRDVETPGVIPTTGSHWREQLAPAAVHPQHHRPRRPLLGLLPHRDRLPDAMGRRPRVPVRSDGRQGSRSQRPRGAAGSPWLRCGTVVHAERKATPEGLAALADRDPELKARVDVLREANTGLHEPPHHEPRPA